MLCSYCIKPSRIILLSNRCHWDDLKLKFWSKLNELMLIYLIILYTMYKSYIKTLLDCIYTWALFTCNLRVMWLFITMVTNIHVWSWMKYSQIWKCVREMSKYAKKYMLTCCQKWLYNVCTWYSITIWFWCLLNTIVTVAKEGFVLEYYHSQMCYPYLTIWAYLSQFLWDCIHV